ncbi:hypothetical protein FLX56_28910 [Synechococcus moorigangaii CMS01]|nr:hypothetical protein [Synechococcus moorigangaii CMS01]
MTSLIKFLLFFYVPLYAGALLFGPFVSDGKAIACEYPTPTGEDTTQSLSQEKNFSSFSENSNVLS